MSTPIRATCPRCCAQLAIGHIAVVPLRSVSHCCPRGSDEQLNPKNIGKQRQLNDDGRRLAKSIGESLSKPRIPVGQVHTSLFQRAIDTGAMMGFGEVKASADYTEGGLVVTPIENNRRPAALRKIVATVPPPGTNVIVVTHKPNILDAFGKDWFDVREGEASVFKPDGNGGYKPIVRIQAGAWSELAENANSFLNLYDLN